MAQAVRKNQTSPPITLHLAKRLREGGLIVLAAVALFLLLALLTHSPDDPGWSHAGGAGQIHNQGGIVGAYVADWILYLFGYMAYLFPLMIAAAAWWVYRLEVKAREFDYFHITARLVGFLLTVIMGTGLFWANTRGVPPQQMGGGILGDVVGKACIAIFGARGGILLMLALFLTGITLLTGLSWLWLMETVGRHTLGLADTLQRLFEILVDYVAGQRAKRERENFVKEEIERVISRPKPRIEVPVLTPEVSKRAVKAKQEKLFDTPLAPSELPSLDLLDTPPPAKGGYSNEALEAMSRQVELKLKDFGVEAQVVAVHPGPVITRFELQPAPGVKASRISNLSKDLARSLSTVSVRVVEVIPGKSVIGLEIPNSQRELVSLSEILSSREYEESASPLTLALGKDIGGKPVVVDLARMPHLLVAGTTGSGKSVALNAMVLSLLYKTTAMHTRLIMIDPKMLELSVYEGIPPLLAPVVTDMKEAANSLRWCVNEMDRRYRLMSALGVRNISGYNRKVEDSAAAGQPLLDPLYQPDPATEGDIAPQLKSLPFIVVIVDELADMMMTVGKKVEELIARLAQKARASGIHLILATQRPSVDVITGLIKANIPSRIAFQVSSRVDSRTILDQMGAENLLGHGDMLYLPPGVGLPTRVHGAFVSDQEVHKVVDRLKRSGKPEYIEAIVQGDLEEEAAAGGEVEGFANGSGGEQDELYDQAVRIVTETRRASVSGVQRRLKIGYNRAARLVEDMERAGIVGALQTNGSREVLAPPPPKA